MSRRDAMALFNRGLLMLAGALVAVTAAAVPAQENEPASDFASIRREHAVAAFDAVGTYLTTHPDAADATEAYRFLFETALEHDLVRKAMPLARQFLTERTQATTGDRSVARRVAMLALAQEGEADAAIELLGEELTALRRIDPSTAIDATTSLAAAVQRGGEPEAARNVYERLQRAFLLNTGVQALAENRLARLELLGKPAPNVGLTDLSGHAVSADDLAGKIVLIDFWATNCPPCLEELPQLHALYADYEPLGFAILAVSLDDDEETVRDFRSRTEVPWRLFLSAADDHATREAYRVETIPANFLIGRDGNVMRVDLHGADLRAEVERLLKDADAKEP